MGMSIPVSLGALLIILFSMPACCLFMAFGSQSMALFLSFFFYGLLFGFVWMVWPHDSLLSYGSCCFLPPIPRFVGSFIFFIFLGFYFEALLMDPCRYFFPFSVLVSMDPTVCILSWFLMLLNWSHAQPPVVFTSPIRASSPLV